MKHGDLAYFLAIHAATFMGARKMLGLIDYFGSAKEAWEADLDELQSFPHLSGKVSDLLEARRRLDPVREYETLLRKGFRATTILDSGYPAVLRNIYDPPAVLYSLGNLEALNERALAVVGARNATPYGKQMARELARGIALAGYWVVSGMARGIDTEAHQGALDVGGLTVAVLGSGLEVIYPRENSRLFDRIAATGVVMSEFPPSTPPEPKNFPIRNRIISGLSRGVVVVEARARSGALITADLALEQGRDVFAVPGPVTSKTSQGTNNLIKQGAKLVSSVEDVLEEYQLVLRSQEVEATNPPLGEKAVKVLELLGPEPVHLDRLVAATAWQPGELATLLLQLEIQGIIEVLPGNYFIKLRDA